jgi:hypothetical protein
VNWIRRHWKLEAVVVVAVLIVLGVIGAVHGKTQSDCVRRQLTIGGYYSTAGITAALRAYPGVYDGPETAPSVNEIEYARGICGLNP